MTLRTDIAIVGAGLSGLAVAEALTRAGRDVLLLEARPRAGGRVLSLPAGGGTFDMGPAWLWPHDRRMRALVARLGLEVFAQHATGRLVFEAPNGGVRRDIDMATMAGALRVAGGLGRVTDALRGTLSKGTLRLGHTVTGLHLASDAVRIDGHAGGAGVSVTANHAVLALPPRLIAGLTVAPPLPDALCAEMSTVPTWMAGHAKIVAVYDTPFWRAQGLSGDGISHRGPLVEIHDATDETTGTGALFGFLAPGAGRAAGVQDAALAQLTALFGPEAAEPAALLLQDWSVEPETAVEADQIPPRSHPAYGLSTITPHPRLILAGTEAAPGSGGFLEGALEAADAAIAALPL